MKFREANNDDISQIAKNNVQLAFETEGLILDYDEVLVGSKTLIKNKNRGFYLIAEEEQIIGQVLITYEWSDWRNKNIWWIHRIYIHENWRRKKIFSRMFKELIKLANKYNVYVIRLYVLQKNIQAKKAYKLCGMESTNFLIYQYKIS